MDFLKEKLQVPSADFKSSGFFSPQMDGPNTELLLNAPRGVWAGNGAQSGRGQGNLCWFSYWALRGKVWRPSCLCTFRTNHVNWKLERGNGHNQHIYHPEGWAFHKFSPAKELENRIDACKNPGWGRGPSKQPFAAIWLGVLEHILFEAIRNMKRRLPSWPLAEVL